MKTLTIRRVSPRATLGARQQPGPRERFEDELIMHLERDQLVAETSRPLQPVQLDARARTGLLALRIFVLLLSVMVIYTFVEQLH